MANTMTKIATQVVGSGGASAITFSSISQGYTDLKLLMSIRNSTSNDATYWGIASINGDSASNYSYTKIFGTGSSTGNANQSNNSGNFGGGVVTANNSTANIFANCEVYIPNYTGSNYKSFIMDSAPENNSSTFTHYDGLEMSAGLWRNTAAISSFTIFTDTSSGGVFMQNSKFTLYGIKNS
jgi:hypothetical protein